MEPGKRAAKGGLLLMPGVKTWKEGRMLGPTQNRGKRILGKDRPNHKGYNTQSKAKTVR